MEEGKQALDLERTSPERAI